MPKNIKQTHPKYDDFKESWQTMRDTIGGEDDVKDKELAYLPMKSGMLAITDKTVQNNAYRAYMTRAEFPELVAPTVRGSTGLITDKMPEITLPSQLEYLRENYDGTGKTLDSLFKAMATEVMSVGRFGLLPGVRDNGTFVITTYTTENIINWDTNDDGAVDYVVLDESRKVRSKETNAWADESRYMECYLNDAGGYEAKQWSGATDTENEAKLALLPSKKTLDLLPFVFVNSSNLEADPDDVPLYGLAKIALRVYRLDADYVSGLHWTSEPTPYVTGFTDPQKAIEEGAVPNAIGASALWVLPEGATAGFLEFSGPGIASQQKAIEDSLIRAVMFGAQVFTEQNRGVESGESRKVRVRGQHSLIRNVAVTAAAGLERVLRNIAIWAGLDPKQVVVKPNLDFVDYSLTAQEVTALVAGWQSGAYSKKTLFENFKRADMISAERTFEEEQELIEAEGLILGTEGREDGGVANKPAGQQPGNSE